MSALNKNDAAALADTLFTYKHDPLGHVCWAYPWGEPGTPLEDQRGPRPWQAARLKSIGDRLAAGAADAGEVIQEAVASGHGVGKSALVAWLIKWAMDTFVDCRGVVTANTDTQLRTKTWPELSKWHRMSMTRDLFTVTGTSIFSNSIGHTKTWRIDLVPWSLENTEAFAGLHNQGKRILVIGDEASAIPDKIWEVTEGALTDESTEIIWAVFGNPTRNTGRFRDCFGKLRHRWVHTSVDSRLVEGTNKTQIQKWETDYGEDSDFFRIRVKGEFPRAGSNQFIDSDLVDAAMKREPVLDPGAALILSVDVARFGDDKSVARFRRGRDARTIKPVKWRGLDLMQLSDNVAGLIERFRPDATVIDGTGIGAGVVDRLRQMGYRVHEFIAGAKASDEKEFYNKRAEVWQAGKAWLETASLDPDPELRDDLIGPEYGFDNRGRLQIEKKDDMKDRGLPSPDDGDALMNSFSVNVPRRDAPHGISRQEYADGTPASHFGD